METRGVVELPFSRRGSEVLERVGFSFVAQVTVAASDRKGLADGSREAKRSVCATKIVCISVAIPLKSDLLSPPREKGRPVVN